MPKFLWSSSPGYKHIPYVHHILKCRRPPSCACGLFFANVCLRLRIYILILLANLIILALSILFFILIGAVCVLHIYRYMYLSSHWCALFYDEATDVQLNLIKKKIVIKILLSWWKPLEWIEQNQRSIWHGIKYSNDKWKLLKFGMWAEYVIIDNDFGPCMNLC